MTSTDILERIQRRLLSGDAPTDAAAMARLVREEAGVITDVDVLAILRQLRDDTTGLGPLESLASEDGVTDILVNGPDAVWVDRGAGLVPARVSFASDAEVRRLAQRLATLCGRRLDDASPFVDGRIPRDDGTTVRVHAMLAPPSSRGTLISLRVLRQRTISLDELIRLGAVPVEVGRLLQQMVLRRKSFLVVGGTATGKTTLLSALLAEVPDTERIVVIEDTTELDPVHPHVVSLAARGNNTEGAGRISLSDLLTQALRMRPDRIVVGEIRGAEVVDLLAALNTGHDGGAGTVHANSLAEVPARMEALAALGGLERGALHSQLAAAVHVVLVMRRHAAGRRYLAEVGVLDGNPVTTSVVWSADSPDDIEALRKVLES